VSDGSHVSAGDAYVEIEAMKMYMPLKAAEAGTVHFQISEGAALSPGDVIANVTLDNPDMVVKAVVFKGTLFESHARSDKSTAAPLSPHVGAREALVKLERILDGYSPEESNVDELVDVYVDCLREKLLPYFETEEALAVLRGRLDSGLSKAILDINVRYRDSIKSCIAVEYPAAAVLSLLHNYGSALAADKRAAFFNLTAPMWTAVEKYIYIENVRILSALLALVERYLEVETHFDVMSFTDVVSELRKQSSVAPAHVLNLCRSHINLRHKNVLIKEVIDEIKEIQMVLPTSDLTKLPRDIPIRNKINLRNLKLRLTELSKLRNPFNSHVALTASLILMEQYTMSPEQRRIKLNEALIAALTTGDPVGTGDRVDHMKRFVDANIGIRDLLLESLRQDRDYQLAMMELYVRKIYQKTHHLRSFTYGFSLGDDKDSNTWLKFELSSRSGVTIKEAMAMRYDSFSAMAAAHGTSSVSTSIAEVEGDSADTWTGLFATAESFEDAARILPSTLSRICSTQKTATTSSTEDANLLNDLIIILMCGGGTDDEGTVQQLSALLEPHMQAMRASCLRRVTFLVADAPNKHRMHAHPMPTVYTFRSRLGYKEDRLCRHIIAPQAFYLDLNKLSNFNISLVDGLQTSSGNVHLYRAVPVAAPNASCRFFARLISFTTSVQSSDAESLFVEALDHLALVIGKENTSHPGTKSSSSNHVFLSIVSPELIVDADFYDKELRRICSKYSQKMVKLAIAQVEIKLTCRLGADSEPFFLRLVATNPTGFVLRIDQYYECMDGARRIFKSIGEQRGEWDGLSVDTPYPVSQKFEKQRAEALASSDTLYVYDWPVLFEQALTSAWEEYSKTKAAGVPAKFTCQELVLCDKSTQLPLAGWTYKDGEDAVLLPMDREMGKNDAGVVAWLLTMKTPECPSGRQVVVIANDITFEAGSFGTREDMMFFKASEYSRTRGLPRIFLAANSGARIGMAQSLKSKFQICWSDERDPSKGFKYIYLTQADYDAMLAKHEGVVDALPLICSPLEAEGETRYVITDIIGEEPDLGVENLMGSGLIAGETSKAYDEVFTLTLVVGRTVGIGAYLVRLGQRTIQKNRMSPIILTGFQALNKLMGREIYTTNDQLGGPMIMFPNGVAHLLAESHIDSVLKALQWLAFVPSKKSAPLPVLDISSLDIIERSVGFTPEKGLTYDPRLLLTGVTSLESWTSGLLDRNSFVEALSGWAKTVIVGRGRLGGIPLGVIVTENRTAEATKPADPADITSQERMVQQAGGVWFPDSAYKTAQALKDFNREGLPCIILANWRGFSGGQRDMFDEVLKFGSMIVDALVAYQQPLFVYIPPHAELRGGAWVVVDSTINADVMEFYAAEDARCGCSTYCTSFYCY
jgi:acetyl-CoA carboxylase/biotin carboxylase 1